MAKASAELVVISKTYDLVIWGSTHIEKFPRSHRFTLGDRLALRLYRVLELLIRAKYRCNRLELLGEANLEVLTPQNLHD